MTPTAALRTGGVLVLIGLVLSVFGFGPQTAALTLPGLAALLLASLYRAEAARRTVPVRARRGRQGR